MAEEIEIPKTPKRQTNNSSRSRNSLVQPSEIAVYIQKSSFQFDDIIFFLTNIEPARFNVPKPPSLHLSDDAWAALQLRVDHVARNILDPHRYYAAATCVAFLITIVFYAIRPGYDRKRIHATVNDDGDQRLQDDEIYDDYIQDDLWERNHSVDDVVVAELNYLNAELDKSMWIWRIGLIVSLVVLFGSVIFIAVLMERRNVAIDDHIRKAIEEIRPRVEDEGIAVEYRTRSSQPGILFFLGRYIRPTRVVVFSYLDSPSPRSIENGGGHKTKKTSSFFSEDYQRRYFPPRSTDEFSASVAKPTHICR
mmetsp:Transcript_23089/g.42419  ORF Transcript_23089/g.42419 Transcript_23089/m.42419 type:complete len:308 (-) Transcript_23089:424-1347(-)